MEESEQGRAEPAGFWIRGLARLADWLLLALINIIVIFCLAFLAQLFGALAGRPVDGFLLGLHTTTWVGRIGGVLVTLAYHTVFEGIAGSTVGKRLIGLQVLSEDLEPITFVQGAKRSLGFLVDAVFLGAVAAASMNDSPQKQRVGDMWAETRVVYRESVPEQLLPSGMRWLGGFAAAMTIAAVLTAISQIVEGL